MPSFYTHHCFGREVSARLGGDLGKIVKKYEPQFRIGLQGPDIFFFYWAHTDNRVVRFGNHLHRVSAYPFFLHARRVVWEKGRDSREYAYLLGYLCHFILDSECHPYVEEMIGVTGVQHLEIEEEFDKLLLRRDGLDPLAYPIAELVPTDEATVHAIQPFYPVKLQEKGSFFAAKQYFFERFRAASEASSRQKTYLPLAVIRNSLRDLKRVKKLLTAPQPWKQNLINGVFKAAGVYDEMCGVMNQRTDNPDCAATNEGLMERYSASVDLAVRMAERFDDSVRKGIRLDARFDRTFS